MRFELVRDRLAVLPRELPAAPAVLTPVRIDSPEALFPDAGRRGRPAAVLVLLFPDAAGQARVLLTARAPQGIGHAGEVSFPGGSAEAGDADPIETAIREATEEVALNPTACGLRVVGALEVFALTVSGFRITPVVATAERRPECRAAPDEVARIVEAPVEAFLPDAPVELEERAIRQRLIRYGVYPVEGERVWGATARMLGQLGALLAEEPAGHPSKAAHDASRRRAVPERRVPASGPPTVRRAVDGDRPAIDTFLEDVAPELAAHAPTRVRTVRGRGFRPACGPGRVGAVGSAAIGRRPARLRRPGIRPRPSRRRGHSARGGSPAARPGDWQASDEHGRGLRRRGRPSTAARLDSRRLGRSSLVDRRSGLLPLLRFRGRGGRSPHPGARRRSPAAEPSTRLRLQLETTAGSGLWPAPQSTVLPAEIVPFARRSPRYRCAAAIPATGGMVRGACSGGIEPWTS